MLAQALQMFSLIAATQSNSDEILGRGAIHRARLSSPCLLNSSL
jgi:hypothetical protein